MKKGIFALAMSAALMLAGTSALADYTFTVHHSGSTSHPYQKGSEYFNEKLTEYSNGTMNLDIYPSNQLAAGSKAVEGTALGTIDIFIENPMLGYWYNGWRNVSNSKRPIEKVEDLKGLTIRIAESQVFADMMEALGMQPVPLANSEIFTALQMGTVDGQENPQNNYINNKYFEVNRYFSMTRHVFSVEPVGMNLDLWNMLTEDEQATLMKAFDDATVYQRQLAQETEENQLKQVLADGADIVVTYIDDLTPFQEAVAGVYDKYKQTDLKPYIEALEAAKAKVGE